MSKTEPTNETFFSAPQSVTSLVAAFCEPTITVAVFLAISQWFEEPIARSDLTLCLLIFALTFPGRNRFWDRPLNAAVDIVTSWCSLLFIIVLCGYATRSLDLFSLEVMSWWALITPVIQWSVVFVRAHVPAPRGSAAGEPAQRRGGGRRRPGREGVERLPGAR